MKKSFVAFFHDFTISAKGGKLLEKFPKIEHIEGRKYPQELCYGSWVQKTFRIPFPNGSLVPQSSIPYYPYLYPYLSHPFPYLPTRNGYFPYFLASSTIA